MFEEQVKKEPGSDSSVYLEDKELIYKELNERSNQLARYLQKKGVEAETLVPICVERGPEMVIGILGILKAGGAYVPIDPKYPAGTVFQLYAGRYRSAKLASRAVKQAGRKLGMKVPLTAAVIELDGDWPEISKEESSNLDGNRYPYRSTVSLCDLHLRFATGKPKGQ